jgi:PAS domain S-box-containing protein
VEVIATFLKLRERYVFAFMRDITERKRAEAHLRLQSAALESAANAIVITDSASNVIWQNPAFTRLTGYSAQEVEGRNLRFLKSGQHDQFFYKKLWETILAGRVWRGEMVNRRKDGSLYHEENIITPVQAERGEITHFVAIKQDITNRKQAEEALHESEARKSAIMQAALDAIVTIDHTGRITDSNPATEKLFGQIRDKLTGKEIAAVLFPPSLREWFGRGLAGRFCGPEGPVLDTRLEMTALRADGAEFPIELSVTRIEMDGPPMFTVFIHDISQRRRAEEQIRLLAYAVQSARDLICITDGENRFTFVNQSFVKAYGHSQEEVLGRKPDFLYSPKNPPGLCEHIFRQTLGGSWTGELLNCRKDGTEFQISLSTSEIKNSEGRTIGLIGVARDITERKRAEEELRRLPRRIIEAQEAERLRVARELHDGVNQLIASAKMRLRKVEDGVVSLNPAAREILARCSRLLVQALEENRRIAHNLRPSDLDEFGLAAASRNFCKELQSRTKLEVKYNIARIDQRLAPALELNLFRIMQEAVNNIEKHAHAREVRLRIAFHGDSIVLKIQDDGRGFDSKRGKAGKGKWRGIGLTNMRERAEFLGGTCTVESAPKRGTTITVRVPCGSAK